MTTTTEPRTFEEAIEGYLVEKGYTVTRAQAALHCAKEYPHLCRSQRGPVHYFSESQIQSSVVSRTQTKDPAKQTEGEQREAFKKSKDLQAEFGGDENAYIAYLKAEAGGRVGFVSGHEGTRGINRSQEKNPQKQTENQQRESFKKSKALQDEFGGDENAYIAYLKAESEGRVGVIGGGRAAATPKTDAELRKEFARSSDLSAEFDGDENAYVAYMKAESEGRAKVFVGAVVVE